MSNFSVRRVEDPTIYVRRNKPDILGSAWDNIVDFKDALNRLEDNIAATDIRQKPLKKPSSYNGPVLKEISSETQHFGKVTRFQLLGEKPGYKGLPKHSASAVEIKTRRSNVDHSKTGPVSGISSIKMDSYSKLSQGASGRNGYSPNRYTVNSLKSGGKIHDELPSFFKTTTVNPVILNDSSLDSNRNKESSFTNTTVNTSTNSQQFSLSSSPSFHGKAVLAKNEAALQKIKEKVQKQKAMLSKADEKVSDQAGDRKLHDSKDEIATPTEVLEKVEMSQVPLKRKVGAVSSSGPTYRGFNSVSGQKTSKKGEKRKHKVQQSTVIISSKESKGLPKPVAKPENKLKKARMNRIIGSRCPKEVITTTSWRDGQATVKKILGSKKIKAQSIPDSNVPAEKTDTTYNVSPRSQEELSEGKLSDEDGDLEMYSPKDDKMEKQVESNIPKMNELDKHSEILSHDSDVDSEEKLKDVLSTEAQSMLADLAQDSSESECETKEDEKPKATGQSKKATKNRKLRTVPKPTVEEKYPKGKSRHYDQTEVQKYMAQQMAERKKKQKQEKILKKKQEDEKQRRLKDLYARQKKSFAGPKREKRFGLTFTSTDNEDLRIPGHEVYGAGNDEYEKFDQRPTPNESDKENTDVNDVEKNSEASFNQSIDSPEDDNISTDDIFSVNEQLHDRAVDHVIQPAPSLPLNQRAQRLTALKATALALQSRLQSQALRLSGGTSERVPSQPVSTVVARPKDEETGFQGALPGVANIRKQAHANERQSTRVEAATKIQAAYRGHTVRKRFHWHDGNDVESDGNSVVSSIIEKQDNHMRHHDDEQGKQTEGSVGDIEYAAIRPLYKEDRLNDLRTERTYFRHADIPDVPITHYSVPSVQYEPRGDRYSVMNIFTRRHPTIPVEDILDERPGSETASLLDAGEGVSRKSDGNVEYEDDFTDEDISTASVLTEQDLNKESPSVSKPETYSECFESDEEQEEFEHKDSTLKENIGEELNERSQLKTSSSLSSVANVARPENKDGDDIIPLMTSTVHPEEHHSSPSISLSDYSEPFRQPVFIRPVQHTGGDRLSPGSLQRKLTAEINLLENVEDSVRQVNDIEKTRVVSLAQQETVSLAQILKQNHEQEMQNLRLKAKDEAMQAVKDLEKTRQAAAMAAASAAEKLAEVQNEAMKTNAENSRKYVVEASKMSSSMLTSTAHQLAEFCKSVTATTSAAVQDLHKINRPTTTLVERATSFSEGHAIQSENSSKSDDHTRTSDVYSNQSKSWETSPSVTSGRHQGGYSSDEFESYKSRIAGHEVSQIKTEPTRSASSVESILEDLPDKNASDDDTTVNEESANDTQSPSTERPTKTDKVHRSVSPLLDYSSQFEDSSHALTDDDIDFRLFPSREHRRKSIKRIKDDSFDEDKGKKKVARTPFESDDSFGKFTVDMIQQYMREEEVRTRHQGAILRLREKSLKEKTNAELQWLEQLKKQSRDKGSDDVMPSIKKRERGILMKLKAEKEEIKCLKAANRAASFQRRFMIYQQQEIHRLHQATMNIREKIQKNVSKKNSSRSSYEPSQDHPKTSSLSKTTSNTQWSQSDSLSKANKSSASLPVSPSAKSVSEDINEEQGTSHASPVVSASSFPSYSTPKSETSKETRVRLTQQAPTEPETSTILNMLSFLESGEQELSNENGERLLKIHKMLVERQQKLVMEQKVTEMINNQRNVIPRSSHGNHTSESARTPATISDVKQTKDGPSELSIPEDLSSVEEIISEEIKENSEKSASDYANCTFDTDETTTSRHATVAQASKQSSEAQIDEEPLSLTETSDHSDYEERIRKLKEEIQREKMKADALERKKQKMKRSAMRKQVLNLEIELKNTRDDIHRKKAEIKTAGAAQASTPPSYVKSSKSSVSSRKERQSLSNRENGDSSLRKPSERITSAQESNTQDRSQSTQDRNQTTQDTSQTTQETSHTSSARDGTFGSSVHEVEESLIEILESPRVSLTLKDTPKASPVLDQNEASDVPEEISEHVDSDSRSTTSIPEESGIANGEQELSSKASDIQEDISERSYTEPQSSTPSISEEIPSIVDDLRDSHGKTPDDEFEHSNTEPRSDTSIPEDLEGSDEKIPEGPDEEFVHSYTEPQSNTSFPERTDDKTPRVSDSVLQHSDTERRSKPNAFKNSDEKTAAVPDDVPEHSYTEPRGSTSIYDESPTSYEKRKQSRGISEEITSGRRSDTNIGETTVDEELDVLSEVTNISVLSEKLPAVTEREDHRSEKSNVLSEKTTSSLRTRSSEKNREESHDVITSEKESHDVIISENELHDVIISEKSVPENSKSLVKSAKSGESKSEGRSQSESSSIAEEIASGYEDEDISDLASMKEESEGLIFGDLETADETDGGVKESMNEEYTDTFTHTSRATAEKTSTKGKTIEPAHEDGGEEKTKSIQSERSESKLLSARELGTKEQEEGADQESEDEKQYSEDFEVDDATISEDIPEILESDEDLVESDNENSFKLFKSDDRDVRGTRDESEARDKGVLDDITDDIYKGIVEDSVETVRSAKNAKSRRITEQRMLDGAVEEKGENLTGEVESRTIDTDSITKDLLADAILQMIAIKRRKKDAGKTATAENEAKHFGTQNDLEISQRLFPVATSSAPTNKTPMTKPPSATGPLGVIPGFGPADERTVFSNALQIAKSNQALDDDALKTMDQDIEGLLGTSLDDDDDEEDFPVKQNEFNDIPLDDTEPSVHEYPPMFAVPHNLQEMTSIANSTVDILLAQKREEIPLENCEPPAQLLGGETEDELDSQSIRSYRNLIFDLTKEVFMDTISQDEVATRPPWAKAKWKGGQKLSRNFRRWKSDDEVRAAVMERVTNLIGLGAPRTTMQTLQRKTPVRGNKKDNVDAILIEELRQEEPQWTDYEEDETTVKFQVADAILNMLLDDTVRVFNAIQAKKNVPDNVLVV